MFLAEQTAMFGTNHVYNCDTFNEMRPPNSSAEYIAAVGRAVYSGMAQHDPDAVWVMQVGWGAPQSRHRYSRAAAQGWLFLDSDFWGSAQMSALLGSVGRGSMLVLDLDSANREQYTRTSSYYGQPFIFNMLHTFGGQVLCCKHLTFLL